MGVNQGGVASGLLFFRKYMADLNAFLNTEFGVCIGEMIIAHILWADDLILMSDTPEGLQHQVNGLFKFCSKKPLVVNAIKTKCMTIGDSILLDLHFNGPLTRYVKLRVAHAPGMPGTFFPAADFKGNC